MDGWLIFPCYVFIQGSVPVTSGSKLNIQELSNPGYRDINPIKVNLYRVNTYVFMITTKRDGIGL